jgi:hypothetical protein
MYRNGVETLRFAASSGGAAYFAARMYRRPNNPAPPHHIADFLNVFAVVSGHGSVEISTDGVAPHRHDLSAGDLVLMRSRDERILDGAPPNGMNYYNVGFRETDWHNFATFAGIDPSWRTAPGPAWGRFDPTDDEAVRPFETAVERCINGSTMLDLLRFWIDVVPRFLSVRGTGEPFGEPPHWLTDAVGALADDGTLRRGVPGLIEHAHVTPTHLSRSVRRFYGTTPTELVLTRRLRRAGVLLATTADPIGEIGHRCGFGTPASFSRAFLAAEGITPSEFRRRSQSSTDA